MYDCYSAILTDFDGYQPVLETDSMFFRGVSAVHDVVAYQDVYYAQHWAYLELMNMDELYTVAGRAGQSTARLDLERRVCGLRPACAI